MSLYYSEDAHMRFSMGVLTCAGASSEKPPWLVSWCWCKGLPEGGTLYPPYQFPIGKPAEAYHIELCCEYFATCICPHTIIHWQPTCSKKTWQLISRGRHFYRFKGIILCNVKRLQFHINIKNNIGAQFNKTYIPLRCPFFKFMDLLVTFTPNKMFPHHDGSIFVFDGCQIKLFFTKISLTINALIWK